MEVLDNALYVCVEALGPQRLEISFVGASAECHLHKFKELDDVVAVIEWRNPTFF